MKSLVDQVGVIRSSQGVLGIAGCHSCVIAAARALVAYRREAAAGGAASPSYRAVAAAATVPAASSLLRPRRLGQFLYETELRRSGRVGRARSAVRRLVASLLFWLPPPPPLSSPRARQLAASAEEAGVTVPAQPTFRPPGYGHLPRDGSSAGGFGGRGEIDPSAASAHNSNAGDATGSPTESGSGDGGGGQDGFSEIEECLWLRVFAAVESHATPCRTEPRQGPTPAHLVPLDKAIASVEEIFGGEGESAATNAVAAAEMVKKYGASRRRKSDISPTSVEDDFLLHTILESVVAAVAVPQLALVMVDY
ncbi:unnamed protein product [Ectocarpus sp. CCAP 1310/34]|nr:unnamed protein product [Ectocarpus sp. CCAP 1310/34]